MNIQKIQRDVFQQPFEFSRLGSQDLPPGRGVSPPWTSAFKQELRNKKKSHENPRQEWNCELYVSPLTF